MTKKHIITHLKKHVSRSWKHVATTIAIVLIIGICVDVGLSKRATNSASTPEDVAKEFFQDASTGKIDAAYALVASETKKGNSVEGFTAFLGKTGLSTAKSFALDTDSPQNANDGKVVSLEGTTILADGSTENIGVQLIKENGTWKINGFGRQ